MKISIAASSELYPERLWSDLSNCGYSYFETGFNCEQRLAAYVLDLAKSLGRVIPGRHGVLVERLVPRAKSDSPLPSLSRQFGRDAFPFHVDRAHEPIPCRYAVLAAVDAGTKPTATLILDRCKYSFSDKENNAFKTGVFWVKNGRKSFFSTISSRCGSYFRWDPGCMFAEDSEAEFAMRSLISPSLNVASQAVTLQNGGLIVLDNWRVLHGRDQCAENDQGRHLLRSCVA